MTRTRATAIGFVAVLLWSLLALFTVGSSPTPPLLLNAICFSIGGTLGLVWTATTGGLSQLRIVPLRVYAFGAFGLFGYHVLYFSALRLAPAAEAGLIAYLWPLLIVLFSGLLPGEKLHAGHLIGAVLGFAGAAFIITGGGSGFDRQYLSGYVLALLCALTWSGLFGAFTTCGRCSDLLGRGILRSRCHCLLGPAFHNRRNDLAAGCYRLVVDNRPWPWPCRTGVLCLGCRRETRGHPTSRHQLLRGTALVDIGPCDGRVCRAVMGAGHCRRTYHRWRAYCGARQPEGRLA